MATTLEDQLLRANRFRHSTHDDVVRYERDVLNLTTCRTYTIVVTHIPDTSQARLQVTKRGERRARLDRTDTWSEIASDAIALAHGLAR